MIKKFLVIDYLNIDNLETECNLNINDLNILSIFEKN